MQLIKNKLLAIAVIFNFIPYCFSQSSVQTPEFASFEPFDGSNMVDLLSGDLSYSVPLFSISSPEGSFPVSIFYHAGVAEDAEASWVGLGWNLNVGAINRFIDEVPDDWNGKSMGVFNYQGGIETFNKSTSLNIFGLGIGKNWGYSKSLYHYDSYEQYNVSVSLSNIRGTNFSPSVGISWGSEGTSPVLGISNRVISANASSNGFEINSVGMTLYSSKDPKEFSAIKNAFKNMHSGQVNTLDVKTRGDGFSFGIGIPSIYFQMVEQRYRSYIFKSSLKTGYGILYAENSFKYDPADEEFDLQDNAFVSDMYVNSFDENTYDKLDTNEMKPCLSFAAYDQYVVSSQGLNGTISPKVLGVNSLRRSGAITKAHSTYGFTKEEFQYVNIPGTNNYDRNYTHFYFNGDNTGYRSVTNPTFGQNLITTKIIDQLTIEDISEVNSKDGSYYNASTKRYGSSQYVDWFTNANIRDNIAKSKGFIEDDNIRSLRQNSTLFDTEFDPDGIGGFMITAADGKIYHYSIPVYNFETIDITERASLEEISLQSKPGKYAYTWLLTAITGPDYVDNGQNGVIDDADFGYWVKFTYGKWSDGYLWRSPYTGGIMHDDGIHMSYSIGRKQLYFLNTIETKTQVAYFIKDLREDGLSAYGINRTIHRDKESAYSPLHIDLIHCGVTSWFTFEGESEFKYEIPERVKNLRISNIIVLNKSDNVTIQKVGTLNLITKATGNQTYDEMKNVSANYVNVAGSTGAFPQCAIDEIDEKFSNSAFQDGNEFNLYYPENIIDVKDISTEQWNVLKSKAIKYIEFDQNYDLGKGSNSSGNQEQGLLTLNKVNFLSKGSRIIPPTKFSYNKMDNVSFTNFQKDAWGFEKDYPDIWSLNEITTSIGSAIKIKYESDSYNKEVVFNGICKAIEITDFTLDYSDPSKLIVECNLPSGYEFDDYFSQNIKYRANFELSASGEGHFPISNLSSPNSPYNGYYVFVKINDTKFRFICTYKTIYNFTEVEIATMDNLIIYGYLKNTGEVGGGLRVSEIIGTDGITDEGITKYVYNIPGLNLTSGVTMYSPASLKNKMFIPYIKEISSPGVIYKYVTIVKTNSEDEILNKQRFEFIVPETSNYNNRDFNVYSSVSEPIISVTDNQSAFTNFGSGSKTVPDPNWEDENDTYFYNFFSRIGVIQNNSNIVGQVQSVSSMNSTNEILAKTNYVYSNTISELGYDQQTYLTGVLKRNWYNCPINEYCGLPFVTICTKGCRETKDTLLVTTTSKIIKPYRLSQIVNNTNDLITLTTFDDIDPFTGEYNTTKVKLPNSDEITSINIPAYSIQNYGGSVGNDPGNRGMGSKSKNIYNKNMLTQQAAFMSIKNNKVISSSIQTWSNDWDDQYLSWNTSNGEFEYIADEVAGVKIWRKHKNFVWSGDIDEDGTYDNTAFARYNSAENLKSHWSDFNGNGVNGWQKTSEVTRYDHWSTPIESTDINGDFVATKKGVGDRSVTAVAALANYVSFTATSFEETENLTYSGGTARNFGGQVVDKQSSTSAVASNGVNTAHTGNYYLKVPNNNTNVRFTMKATDGMMRNCKYQASVWRNINNQGLESIVVLFDNAPQAISTTLTGKYGNWELITLDFFVSNSVSKVEVALKASSGEAWFDDFRVAPYNSAVASYVYDKYDQLTAILGNDNLAVKYTYDAAGRLTKTERETPEGFAKTSSYQYNYAEQFNVSPSEALVFPAKGVESFRFDVNCKFTDYTVSLPAWMSKKSQSGKVVLIDVLEETSCNTTNSGNIVFTSSAGEVVTIPVEQAARPIIEVVSPFGGLTYHVGQSLPVAYRACVSENFKADIVYSTGSPDEYYFKYNAYSDLYNCGTYCQNSFSTSWTIPELSASGGWYANQALRLRISRKNYPNEFAVSDEFYIDPTPVYSGGGTAVVNGFTITSPMIDDCWVIGETYTVNWTKTGTLRDYGRLSLNYGYENKNYNLLENVNPNYVLSADGTATVTLDMIPVSDLGSNLTTFYVHLKDYDLPSNTYGTEDEAVNITVVDIEENCPSQP